MANPDFEKMLINLIEKQNQQADELQQEIIKSDQALRRKKKQVENLTQEKNQLEQQYMEESERRQAELSKKRTKLEELRQKNLVLKEEVQKIDEELLDCQQTCSKTKTKIQNLKKD